MASNLASLPETKRPPGRSLTVVERERFLDALAKVGTISGAARAANVGRQTIYDLIHRDAEFSLSVKDAQNRFDDHLIEALYAQGVEGTPTPVFQKGQRAVDHDGSPATILTLNPRALEILARVRIPALSQKHLSVEHSIRPGDAVYLTQTDLNLLPVARRRELVGILTELSRARDVAKRQAALPAPAIDAEFSEISDPFHVPVDEHGNPDI